MFASWSHTLPLITHNSAKARCQSQTSTKAQKKKEKGKIRETSTTVPAAHRSALRTVAGGGGGGGREGLWRRRCRRGSLTNLPAFCLNYVTVSDDITLGS